MPVSSSTLPGLQPLPPCHRHDGLFWPGECQYILAAGECIHDLGPPPAEYSNPIPETVDLVREWGRIGSPGTVRIDGFSNQAEARVAGARLAYKKHRKGYR
jgi:hypothetical protein